MNLPLQNQAMPKKFPPHVGDGRFQVQDKLGEATARGHLPLLAEAVGSRHPPTRESPVFTGYRDEI